MLMGLLFLLDEGVGLLPPGLLACLVHELAHAAAIRALGGRIACVRLTAVGAEMELDSRRPLSCGGELAAALAGPMGSFLCAWAAAELGWWLLAGLSLGQGLFNLLPIPPLDGGRALYALLAGLGRAPEGAGRLLTLFSAGALGLLFGLSLVLLRRYGNPTLTVTSLWLLAGALGGGAYRPGIGKRKNGAPGRKQKILAFPK